MTRRLIASGSKPTTVGTFFSLGHSTIVIITSIVVAATSGALEKRFDGFSKIGGIIGSGVSAGVLIILGIGNLWILVLLVKNLKALIRGEESNAEEVDGFKLEGGGILARGFKSIFKLIDRPWKMYPLGVLFGLGFDTSSEIAVLGIASIQAAQGTSLWLILIFPVLFTCKFSLRFFRLEMGQANNVAGMCLIDTTDGALMMTLYTSTSLARDMIAILYYSIVLTAITVVVAMCIGVIQLLTLILNVANPTGKFWDGVNVAGDNYEIIGGSICGAFVVFGIVSVLLYKPWRRRVNRWRMLHVQPGEVELQKFESNDEKSTGDMRAQELPL